MATVKKNRTKKGLTYKITVSAGLDATGKQIRHYLTYTPPSDMAETKADKEAQKAAVKFEEKIKLGYAPDCKKTFAEYAEYVLQLKRRAGLKRTTDARYQSLLERINIAIGHLKVTDIRPQHLNMLYENLMEANIRSSQSQAKAIVELREIFKKRGLSLSEVSRQTGMSHSTVRKACDGGCVTLETAEKIAAVLGTEVDELFKLQSETAPLSSKTVLEYHRLIHTVLATAEKELIVPYNAASKAMPPRAEAPERETLEPDEVKLILKALEEEPLKWQALIHLLIVTGARRGELMGLRWGRVDLDHNTIHIAENLLYLSGGTFSTTPKTRQSRRLINIPQQTAELLKAWKAESIYTAEDDFVFCRKDGKAMQPDALNQFLRKFSERHGLPKLYPHLFRHTQASLLIHEGTNIVSVSKRLGHSNASTTLNTYAHIVKEADARASDCIADVLLK